MIAVTYKLNGNITSKHEIKGRDRRNMSTENFKRKLNLTDWISVFNTDNVDVANYELKNKFVKILESEAPMGKIQPRRQRSDWISDEVKNLMKMRDISRNEAVKSSQEEDWKTYREQRNLCNMLVKRDRKLKLEDTYEKYHKSQDSRGLYNLTKKSWMELWRNTGEVFNKWKNDHQSKGNSRHTNGFLL